MSRSIIIIGAGGHGRKTAQLIRDDFDGFELMGFLDDKATEGISGAPVIGTVSGHVPRTDVGYVIAIGTPAVRERIVASLSGATFVTLVHPSAYVSSSARLGEGVFVGPLAYVGNDVVIGNHVMIDTRAVVEHDAKLGSFVTCAPGSIVLGSAEIGEKAYLGSGSLIRNTFSVGDGAIVGMGAVVVRDTDPHSIVVGNPARKIEKGDDDE